MTEYRPIPSLPGYLAGSDGSIIGKSGRLLKLRLNMHGYPSFQVVVPGTRRCRHVAAHAAVCEAWHGPRPDGMQVAHGNGVRNDNRPENLRWATGSENQLDRYKHGTDPRGEKNPSAKLTEGQVREIRKLGHLTLKRIGEMYGVHLSTIALIRSGRLWGYLK